MLQIAPDSRRPQMPGPSQAPPTIYELLSPKALKGGRGLLGPVGQGPVGACWGLGSSLHLLTTHQQQASEQPRQCSEGCAPWMQSPSAEGLEGVYSSPPSSPSVVPSPGERPPPPPSSPPANPFHATQPASPTRSPGGNCDERDGGASDAGTGGGDGGGASAGCGLCGPAVKRFQEGRRWWCCTFTLTPL